MHSKTNIIYTVSIIYIKKLSVNDAKPVKNKNFSYFSEFPKKTARGLWRAVVARFINLCSFLKPSELKKSCKSRRKACKRGILPKRK